jgi:hypothetical protein
MINKKLNKAKESKLVEEIKLKTQGIRKLYTQVQPPIKKINGEVD